VHHCSRGVEERGAHGEELELLPPIQEEVVHAPEVVHPDALDEVTVGLCAGARAGLKPTPQGELKTSCRTWSTTDRRGGEVTHAAVNTVAAEEPEPRSAVYTDVTPTLLQRQARRRHVQERHADTADAATCCLPRIATPPTSGRFGSSGRH
jgi:hypothetical protein